MKESLRNTYAGTRVLITGHTGFKGSWLSLLLRKMGADISGLALEPLGPQFHYVAADVEDIVKSHIGDIRDFETVQDVITAAKPEIIFHLAAQPLVRDSYRNPVETFETNVLGTTHVLEAARRIDGLKAIIVATSDKCYENRETGRAFQENDHLGGFDPYSASKASQELVTMAYRHSFFGQPDDPPVASVRAGNVIGGGDFQTERLVPDAIRAWKAGQLIHIRNPTATRPWQHVLDPVGGYALLAHRMIHDPSLAGAWNFGPDAHATLTVEQVVQKLTSRLEGLQSKYNPTDQMHEAQTLRLDSTKAQTRLGWRPVLAVDEAMDWTCDWHRQEDEAPTISRRQVQQYLKRLENG